jgi:hypothetical protein
MKKSEGDAKEKRRALPTSNEALRRGKLHMEFDPQKPGNTIPQEIDKWLSDKGLA